VEDLEEVDIRLVDSVVLAGGGVDRAAAKLSSGQANHRLGG
jgi:hypothetical protein